MNVRIVRRLVLFVAVFIMVGIVVVPNAHAGANTPAFVQQKAGAFATTQNTGCAFSSNVGTPNLLIVSFSWYATSITVSSETDTIGNTFVDAGVVSQSSSTQDFKSDIWYAVSKSAGADTIIVGLSAAPTFIVVTCLEFSGTEQVLRATEQTATGTYTSGTSFTASVTSFTPTSGDLNYAYTGFLACSATGTITYATGFTAGTGKGTDAATVTKCITTGNVKFQFNEADQYFPNTGTTATTASFAVADSAPTTNTGGWAEIVLQFKPTFANTASLSSSVAMAPALTHITNILKTLIATVQSVSSFAEKSSLFRSLAGSLSSVSGLAQKSSFFKTLSSSLSPVSSLAEKSSLSRSMSASLSLSSSVLKARTVTLTGSLGSATSLAEKNSLFRSLSGSLSLVFGFVEKSSLFRALSGSLGSTSSFVEHTSLFRSLSSSLTLAGSGTKGLAKVLNGSMGSASSLVEHTSLLRSLTGSLTLVSSETKGLA